MASAAMYALYSDSQSQPPISHLPEEAGQTFYQGVPVQLSPVDGGVQVWDGVTVVAGIAGISLEAASNLATTGTPKTLTFGNVPFEASAVNIPRGAPLNDGHIGFEKSSAGTIFFGQIGPSQSLTGVNIGSSYGLTADTDGHWYVDTTKTGAAAVVTVTAFDYNDTTRGVHFVFLGSAMQSSSA
jgi:hypothetical protein